MDANKVADWRSIRRISHPDEDVSACGELPGPVNTNALHDVFRFPETRSVRQKNGNARQGKRDFDLIARGSGNVRDDRPLLPSDGVDQAGLPGVRRTCNDDANAIPQWLHSRTIKPRREFFREHCAVSGQIDIRADIVLIGVIDCGFSASRKLDNPALPKLDLVPEAAFGNRQRGLALRFGFGLEQIRKPLGFCQVDAPILESSPREFAGLGLSQPIVQSQFS